MKRKITRITEHIAWNYEIMLYDELACYCIFRTNFIGVN